MIPVLRSGYPARLIRCIPRLSRTYASVDKKHPLSPNSPIRPGSSQSISISPLSAILLATFVGTATYALALSPKPLQTEIQLDSFQPPTQEGFDIAIIQLQKFMADEWSIDRQVLESHSTSSWSYHDPTALVGAVIFPRSTEDVIRIVKLASEYHIPIIPYSGGTSLEGHCNSIATPTNPNEQEAIAKSVKGEKLSLDKVPRGLSWCLDFSENFGAILAIHDQDLDIVVQPGISYDTLNATLKEKGIPLFFPVDPAPGAMIGGMCSTGASGTNAFRYGTMRENVLSMKVVLANGELIQTRSRAKKSSVGPNLGQLFIGAEGTLGIIVEITLKLQPILSTSVAVAHFPTIALAAAASRDIVQQGISVACVELLDSEMMKAINLKNLGSRKPWEESSTLFIKFTGSEEGMKNDVARVKKIVATNKGSKSFTFGKNEQENEEIWYSRKIALWSALEYLPGCRCLTTDSCVPISELPAFITYAAEETQKAGLIGPIVAHAADGNVHSFMLYRNDEEFKLSKEVVHKMVTKAQAMGGTCTGEHGVGIGKKQFLEGELGPGTVELLREVKKLLDPKNIMNPGKLIPERNA